MERTLRLLQSKDDGYKASLPGCKRNKNGYNRYRYLKTDRTKKEGDKMEEIILQRKLEALGQNGTLIRKDGKTFLQLDCKMPKLSMKWGRKALSVYETGKKWILELPFSTAVNYDADLCRWSGGS